MYLYKCIYNIIRDLGEVNLEKIPSSISSLKKINYL